MAVLRLVVLVAALAMPAVFAAPCGPETLVWLGKMNIEGSKMEFPPTDGVCYPIINTDVNFQFKVCGPGNFKFSPYSCSNHGNYGTGDINIALSAGDACQTRSGNSNHFGAARSASGGGSYTV